MNSTRRVLSSPLACRVTGGRAPILRCLSVIILGAWIILQIEPAAAAGSPANEPTGRDSALYFLQQLLNAVQVSAFYALLTVAYVLVYGITNRINLAFGATAMWAGYLTIGGITVLTALSPLGVAAIVLLAVLHALVATAALGLVIERLAIRPIVHASSLAILITTIGIAIVLEEIMRIVNRGREKWLEPILNQPIPLVEAAEFSIQITVMRAGILVACTVLALALVGFIGRHPFGRVWRACAQDLQMAALCGIKIRTALTWTFLLASAYAAASGAVIALYYGNVNFYMGTVLGFKTLLAAVIGGLHSVGGAFVGAFILGFLESFWSAYFDIEYRDVFVFAVLVMLMVFRPAGLFSPRERADHRLA